MDDVIPGGVCRFVMLGLHCRHFTWNCLEGFDGCDRDCTVIVNVTVTVNVTVPVNVTVTVTATVTVTVNRLGAPRPGLCVLWSPIRML